MTPVLKIQGSELQGVLPDRGNSSGTRR